MSEFSFSDLLGNAEGFKVIPEATYEAIVDRAEARQSKGGKAMFAVMFKIDGGPSDGHAVWTNLVVSPESPVALGIFFRQMSALGLSADFFEGNPTPEQVAHALTGKRAEVKVTVAEFPKDSGNMKNEIGAIKISKRAVGDPLAPATPAAPAASAPAASDAPSAPPKEPF